MKEMRNIELKHKRVRSARIILYYILYILFNCKSVLYDVLCGLVLFFFCLLVFLCLVNFCSMWYVLSILERNKAATYQFVLSFLSVNLFRGKRL